jgi:hypothetical protein
MSDIDWNAFKRTADAAARRAADETNDTLASRLSSVTRLKDEEIKKLFPDPADIKRVAKLLEIVNGAATKNRKIAALKENIDDLAGVTLKLVKYLV